MKPGDYESTRLSGTTGRHSTTAGTCGDLVPAEPDPERLALALKVIEDFEREAAEREERCGPPDLPEWTDGRVEWDDRLVCLIWQGSTDADGYPRVRSGGKVHRGNRLMWRDLHGEIPEHFVVMHLCDRPECVNPDHLVIGTQRANVADRELKGRGVVPNSHVPQPGTGGAR